MHKFAVLFMTLLLPCAAMAADNTKDDGVTPAAHGWGGGSHGGTPRSGWHGGPRGGTTSRGTQVPRGVPRGGGPWDGGRSAGDHRIYRGGGVVVVPYPGWPYPLWPYPAYPYPYQYPYPDSPDTESAPDEGQAPNPGDMMMPRPFWYYCDQPDGYYPYVKSCSHDWSVIPMSPPPPGAAPPLSYASWEWCEESKSFFPYVASCPKGFVAIPVTAPHSESAAAALPTIANWFFCEDPKGYLPYVSDCKKDWRAVPSVPPPSVPITEKKAPQ